MIDKISDERILEWRESIQWLNSPIPELREFAELQKGVIDELLSYRAAKKVLPKIHEDYSSRLGNGDIGPYNHGHLEGWNDCLNSYRFNTKPADSEE